MLLKKQIASQRCSNNRRIVEYVDGRVKVCTYWEFELKGVEKNKYTLVQQNNGIICFFPKSPIPKGLAVSILREWLFEDECWYDIIPANNPPSEIVTKDYLILFRDNGSILFKDRLNSVAHVTELLLKVLGEF